MWKLLFGNCKLKVQIEGAGALIYLQFLLIG